MNTIATAPILHRLSALGDETRARILAVLEKSELTVSELCTVLQLPQPNVSRHLKTLASEGWIEVRAEGRSRHYRLAHEIEPAARELWVLVREQVRRTGAFRADADRAGAVMRERRRRSEAFFAEAAERWDGLREDLFGPSSTFAPLLGLLDPGSVVGDLGAGTGAFAERLAPFVSRVIGVDRSPEMLAAARLRLDGVSNVEFRAGELEDLPIGDAELDVAVLALVLHYVVAPEDVLAEVRRVLAPGGRLVLVDMRAHDRGVGYVEEMGHVWPGFELRQVETWLGGLAFEASRVLPLQPDLDASGPPLFIATAIRP